MKVLLDGWRADDSDGRLAARLRNELAPDERLAMLIDADAPLSGGPLARPALSFEEASQWRLTVLSEDSGQTQARRLPAEGVRSGAWRSLIGYGETLSQASPWSACEPAGPAIGLVRREHASVEFRSAGGTRLVFDPVFLALNMGYLGLIPAPSPGVTAAFVTHSHADHFDIATLDYLASGGATIYVPEVPAESMLSIDMAGRLADCGIPHRSVGRSSLTEIGDVTIEALPFFGEQPSARVSPADHSLRNWGSCYRIDSDGLSVLMLADSGTDPSGDMLSAIGESVRMRGPIDVVLGCLRDIYLPFEMALRNNYTTLPFSGLRADYELMVKRELPSVTLGVSGMARACAEARAKVFLPYAHGMTGYLEPVREHLFGPGPGLDESAACSALAAEVRSIGCSTRVTSWNPGEQWTPAR